MEKQSFLSTVSDHEIVYYAYEVGIISSYSNRMNPVVI